VNRLILKSPYRPFSFSPVAVPWEKQEVTLIAGDETISTQLDERKNRGYLVFIPPPLAPDTSSTLTISKNTSDKNLVTVVDDNQGKVDFLIQGKLFTTYHYGKEVVRPYLNPVSGPAGISLVRKPVPPGNPEKLDHIHHRGIWVAHGNVNGTDNWSEETGHGWTRHQKFLNITSGPVFGRLHALSYWTDCNQVKIMEEERIITVYALPEENRIIDHEVIFRASEGEVVFKDTKESGFLSVRVNPSIEVTRTGRFVNSHGAVNEKECWGKRAMWCDYYGQVNGQTVGIAVFDHPANFRYPTWWHIRNYGLMTANCLGLSDFTGDKRFSGTYILPAFQEMKLNYRIFIHSGTTEQASTSQRYLNYLFPPEFCLQ